MGQVYPDILYVFAFMCFPVYCLPVLGFLRDLRHKLLFEGDPAKCFPISDLTKLFPPDLPKFLYSPPWPHPEWCLYDVPLFCV